MRFAFLADFGTRDTTHTSVTALVRNWHVDGVVTGGDNIYGLWALTNTATANRLFEDTLRKPYADFFRRGAFFPAIGNHDVEHSRTWFRDMFPDLFQGRNFYAVQPAGSNVAFFMLSSGITSFGRTFEPAGNTLQSEQRRWLETALATSQAKFKVVVLHHPPYTSGDAYAPGYKMLRWPFADMGAHLVLSGHEHNYERLEVQGTRSPSAAIPYIVAGIGGGDLRHFQLQLQLQIQIQPQDQISKDAAKATATATTANATAASASFGRESLHQETATSLVRLSFHGALLLTETPEGLLVQAIDVHGTEQDRVLVKSPGHEGNEGREGRNGRADTAQPAVDAVASTVLLARSTRQAVLLLLIACFLLLSIGVCIWALTRPHPLEVRCIAKSTRQI